ncbi:MAG: DNA ligase D, partial [Acetobacteraceae bacterium]|nr:DNA ligase D [Acetobacteraceae bacterium]
MATKKLEAYRAKRDFTQTSEPSGQGGIHPAPRLRFVIQKHAATRLHYDLRLELDGVFKSWAVTKGPSLDPHDRRLAVEVEDHPLDYGDFEGTIPKGQYGGGTVMLWDRGYWEPEGMSAEAGLAKGDLKFRLDGNRLHGSWVLVRIKNDRTGGKRTNWLLIKHRDEWAREGADESVLAQDRSVASGRSMEEIAAGAGKAPKPFMDAAGGPAPGAAAVWDSTIGLLEETRAEPAKPTGRKTKSAPLPDFFEPQLATLVDRPPAESGWAHEIKFDGYRMQLRVENGTATLRTRKGLDWTDKFAAIARASGDLPDCIIDGEAVALDANGAPDFAALQAALAEGQSERLVYFAFDLLDLEGQDLRERPLSERKARLKTLLEGYPSTLIRYVEHFETGGDAVLKSACHMSLEGIVSKRLNAPYRPGRSADWLKSKCRAGHEVVIGGWSTTNGNFRSLLVGAHRDGHFVYLGRVGTGFGAAKVRDLMPKLLAAEQPKSPFTGPAAPRPKPDLHFTAPRLVAEIEFAGWSSDGLVRQAAFKSLRGDKPADEVQAETPASPAETAELQPAPQAASGNVVMGVAITRGDKLMWPEAGHDGTPVTKLDLARYYETVGSWMMPHIKGRPCSLVRYPDGIQGEKFFQRHAMAGQSNLIDLVTFTDDRKPYIE